MNLHPVAGVEIGVGDGRVRKANRKDLVLFALGRALDVAAVFTRNPSVLHRCRSAASICGGPGCCARW